VVAQRCGKILYILSLDDLSPCNPISQPHPLLIAKRNRELEKHRYHIHPGNHEQDIPAHGTPYRARCAVSDVDDHQSGKTLPNALPGEQPVSDEKI